jgi:hypothetical protein
VTVCQDLRSPRPRTGIVQAPASVRAAFGDDAGEMTPVRLYEETAGIRLCLSADGEQAA